MLGTIPMASSLPGSLSLPSFFTRHCTAAQPGPEHEKFPLLTLKLSSPSFLDALVYDDVTERPLYTVKTSGSFTAIHRADPWDGATKTAEIGWPRHVPDKGKGISDDVVIQMRGIRWEGSEAFLRRGSGLSTSRKFNIPNYSQSLKWRRVGSLYWCETASVKGPIAIFDPSDESSGPRLIVYETLHDRYDVRPNLIHHGVSLLLLDYLLVTALFLVTNVQDWIRPENFTHAHVNITSDLTPSSSSSASRRSMTDVQWRKVMFGEPLFRKRSRSSLTSLSSDGPARLTADQMAKLAYGHPLYPKLRSSTPDFGLSDSEDDDQQLYFSPIRTRPPSPAAESIFDPRSAAGAPSHNYIDPSFYSPLDRSPAIPSPVRYTQSSGSTSRVVSSGLSEFGSGHRFSSSRSSSSRTSSVYTATTPDTLPELPPVLPLMPRPRSTPPRSISSIPATPISPAPLRTPSDISVTIVPPLRPLTMPRRPSRQLPQLPIKTPSPSASITSPLDSPTAAMPPARLSVERSRSRSSSFNQEQKWSNAHYRQRTLPSPPTSSGSTSLLSPGEADHSAYSHLHTVLKEYDVQWLAGRREHGSDGVRLHIPYDVPPPAYNSIFSGSPVPSSNVEE